MNKRQTPKHKQTATPELDPAKLAQQKVLERQRKNAARALLNKRRRKSGQ
jgi:hypothetical protein